MPCSALHMCVGARCLVRVQAQVQTPTNHQHRATSNFGGCHATLSKFNLHLQVECLLMAQEQRPNTRAEDSLHSSERVPESCVHKR